MYTAVIFNPVPGPPMGPRTRLTFRYKLTGTDKLRVQIYSLTNGYHRHLTLTGLPQGEWREAAVDLTQARRPDGGGGPLSADERIDDIQFYTDPSARLLIDDIVLYEAAPEGEARPFPKRVIFTGWFDTGRQGAEWPGSFDIVPHQKPRTWKVAKAVPGPDGVPWVRVGLRGKRPLGAATRVRFRYLLTGADALSVKRGGGEAVAVKGPKAGAWAEADLQLPGAGGHAEELHFLAPKGAELLIDDVLLYEPG
jgi:hypothetical protein